MATASHAGFLLSVLTVMGYIHAIDGITMLEVMRRASAELFITQEEAPYSLVKTGEDYQERIYPTRRWACKAVKGSKYDELQNDVFLDLFGYVYGENDADTDMGMSVPVSIEAPVKSSSDFEICFFISQKYQDNPPKPNSKNVFIKVRPEMTIFSRKFGGYATSHETWSSESTQLNNSLSRAGEPHTTRLIFWNAFDSPLKFWSRRNEVWILKSQ